MNDKEPAEKMLEYCKQLEDENIITTYFNQEKEREKEQNKMNIINEFNKITYINYDISNHYSFDIDFLFDYCKILGSEKNDSKLIQWQVMNKDRLFIYGLNMAELMERINKSQPKGANSKLDTIISNLNYRLQRHGRLAPTKDIARKLDKKFDDQLPLEEEEADNDIDIEIEEDIAEDKNNNMNNNEEGNENNIANNNNVNNKNLVQENYYDINDPFIDDNLDEISEGEDNKLLFKLKLKPGNYTESEIMNNLRKHLRPKKNFKRIKTKIHTSQTDNEATNDNEENINNIPYKTNSDNYVDITEYTKNNVKINENDGQKNINYINANRTSAADRESMIENILGQTMLQKKTQREISNSNNSNNSTNNQQNEVEKKYKKKKIDKSQLIDLNGDKIMNVIRELKNGLSLNTDHEKETFIRRNVKILSEIYDQYPKYLFVVIQRELNIDYDISEYLLEYEIFRSKMEYFYSNFSKFLNKLCVTMKNYGISKIASVSELYKFSNMDNEIEKCLKHVIHNIYDFRQSFNLYIGKHYLDLYIIHEKLSKYLKDIKERNKGLILKLSYKFDEIEKEFNSVPNRKLISEYLLSKYINEDFNENFDDDRSRIYSLDAFIYKEKGNNVKIFLESNEINGDITRDIEDNFENDNKTEKMLEINNEDLSYKTYDNSSMRNDISSEISSPSKSVGKPNEGSVQRNISVNIRKEI